MRLKTIITLLLLGSICSHVPEAISQQVKSPAFSCDPPLDLDLLNDRGKESTEIIVTAETISQDYLAVPSLWWAKEKIDTYQGKLVSNWLAYPQQQRIDLIVNWQVWNRMDYLQKYAIVNDYGYVARSYGYNLRIFDRQSQCLALYYYDNLANPPRWEVYFNSSENNGWQLQPDSF